MGERSRPPGSCRVAGITGLVGLNMCRRLDLSILSGICAGVTGRTLPRRSGMAHLCRLESKVVGVAAITLGRTWNVVGRLAQRDCSIVASAAAPGRHRVQKRMILCMSRPCGR